MSRCQWPHEASAVTDIYMSWSSWIWSDLGQVSIPMQPEGPCYILSLPKTLKLFGYSCVYLCMYLHILHKAMSEYAQTNMHAYRYTITYACVRYSCMHVTMPVYTVWYVWMSVDIWVYKWIWVYMYMGTVHASMCMLWTSECIWVCVYMYKTVCLCVHTCM